MNKTPFLEIHEILKEEDKSWYFVPLDCFNQQDVIRQKISTLKKHNWNLVEYNLALKKYYVNM